MRTVNADKFTLFVFCNFLVLLSTTVCSQNINKQNVNIADKTDYSFLSRYHYTKSKNYLKRRYWIRHWIPMFIGTPCKKHSVPHHIGTPCIIHSVPHHIGTPCIIHSVPHHIGTPYIIHSVPSYWNTLYNT